jgi:nitroimidazol reductase NimA-like FMN-containing flavoprotein (pyridoxamine 5'-phosphate oxidase superfamily)
MTTNEGSNTEELPVATCWQLMRESVVGRLAVVARGLPDIFPINHVVDHGSVVFRTGAGTKLSAAAGHEVAFEVDGYDSSDGTAWSVVVKGIAHEIWETNESIHALSLELSPWHEGRKPRFLRIEPNSVTGRRLHVIGGARRTSS